MGILCASRTVTIRENDTVLDSYELLQRHTYSKRVLLIKKIRQQRCVATTATGTYPNRLGCG